MTQARDLADNKLTGDVEIDGTTLTVDSTNNRVGMGTDSPRSVLDLNTTRDQKIRFGTAGTIGETQNDAGDYIANNLFVSADSGGTKTYTKTTGDNGNCILQDFFHGTTFYTGVTGAQDTTGTLNDFERMRIDSNGNLLVGNTNTDGFDGTAGLKVANSTPGFLLERTGTRSWLQYIDTNGGWRLYDSTDNIDHVMVDTSGNVLKPYNPAFRAYYSFNGLYSLNANDIFRWDGTLYNRGNHFNTTSMLFTAPVNGVYHFDFYSIVSGAYTNAAVALWVNGAQTISYGSYRHFSPTTANWDYVDWSLDYYLNAGDTFTFANMYQTVSYHGGNWSSFSGHLVG